MDIEFEATFTDVDKDAIRKLLEEKGAELVRPEFMQRRIVLSLPSGHEIKGGWLRVRDEGNKTTLTLKIVDGDQIENQKEVSLKIDDFSQAETLLTMMGCKKNAYQESKRELWKLDDVEITIDEWPFLEPFVEVEGKSKQAVQDLSAKLGFDFDKALFCAVDKLYALKYNISEDVVNNQTPEITFDGENPFENRAA